MDIWKIDLFVLPEESLHRTAIAAQQSLGVSINHSTYTIIKREKRDTLIFIVQILNDSNFRIFCPVVCRNDE